MGKGPTWTTEQDELLAATLVSGIESGRKVGESCELAALELGRSIGSCKVRWSQIRNRYPEVQKIISKETGRIIKKNQRSTAEIQDEERDPDVVLRFLFGELRYVDSK